jgi:LacI family transcriptional regulator, galactose operon repressor
MESPGRRKPTQEDVARVAGVSQALVSYVINNTPTISIADETRRRIRDAVIELGYVPNSAARSLRTRKTMSIASLIPDITNPFYPALERGIQDVAESNGYDLIIYNTDGIAEKERKGVSSVRQRHVDGLIMTVFHLTPDDFRLLREDGTAIVVFGPNQEGWMEAGIDNLFVENTDAAYTIVNHLINRGHRRIAMIAGVEATPPRERRVLGYKKALAEHDIPLDPILIRGGDFNETGGYKGMKELLKLNPRPTAVFAANDLMAIGTMIALREEGLDIPGDIAVVGFDDIPAASLVNPPLTTIAQFPEQLGKRAAQMLLERLRGEAPDKGRFETHHCDLVIRNSA